jgi:tRNA dimethylallyltransferase
MSKVLNKNFIIALVGQTASGKSELAVKLAKKYNGEIVCIDSRQIYKGLDLGTGKVEGKWQKQKQNSKLSTVFIYKNIPHYCIDYVNPKKQYSASLFQKDAKKAIDGILERGKLPILCGGTAHWVDAVVYNQNLPDVKPNKKLRATLEKKSADALFEKLIKLDPTRASTIDRFNKRRLIRALEIIAATGKPIPSLSVIPASEPGSSPYDILWLGIQTNQKLLYKKIEKRLEQRLKDGMVTEVKKLHSSGISWKKLESFGLEYRFISLYLQKKMTYDEMFTQLLYAIKHYSKRQATWWKKNIEINWIKNEKQAYGLLSSRKFFKL